MWWHTDSIKSDRSLCESARVGARETNKAGSQGPAGVLERRLTNHLAARTWSQSAGWMNDKGLVFICRRCYTASVKSGTSQGRFCPVESGWRTMEQCFFTATRSDLFCGACSSRRLQHRWEQVLVAVLPFYVLCDVSTRVWKRLMDLSAPLTATAEQVGLKQSRAGPVIMRYMF